FGGGVTVVDGHRRVIGACDRDGHRGDAAVGLAVIGFVSEAVGAVVVGRGGVTEPAVAVHGQTAIRGLADRHCDQAVAVAVDVVALHSLPARGSSGVFGGGVTVVDGHRRVIGACDRDGHRGDAAVGLAVIGFVSEAVGAVVVGRRGVTGADVGVQVKTAMRMLSDQHCVQGVAVAVDVFALSLRDALPICGVFGGGVTVVDGHRRVVGACDCDGHRGNAAVGLAVIGFVSEAVGAVVVGSRGVTEAAVADRRSAALEGLAN